MGHGVLTLRRSFLTCHKRSLLIQPYIENNVSEGLVSFKPIASILQDAKALRRVELQSLAPLYSGKDQERELFGNSKRNLDIVISIEKERWVGATDARPAVLILTSVVAR